MITPKGYSKDRSIIPEGIVITFGREMMEEWGGPKIFLSNFLNIMKSEDEYWLHKCSNLPTIDFDHVYISVMGRLWGRVYNAGITRNPKGVIATKSDGMTDEIDWNFITLAGAFQQCPFKMELKGFQGFRYCTKLF